MNLFLVFYYIICSPMKILNKILPKLFNKNFASFSVHNYMKTFQSSQVTRHHGFFRVDEYNHFDNDQKSVEEFISQQNRIYGAESAKWKHITEEYYKISNSRRDSRLSIVPQRIDNYQYFTKTAWKGDRQYSTVYRCKQNGQQELILDIMAFPLFSRHYKTVQLIDLSFSLSHSLLAFTVDMKNNEKRQCFIIKTNGSRKLVHFGTTDRLQDANDIVFASEKQVYYVKNENHRPCRLCLTNIQNGETKDLLFEQNEQYYLGLRMSKDKKYLFLSGVSKTNSRVWMIDLSNKGRLTKIWQGVGKVYINHVQNSFIVWTVKDLSEIRLIGDQSIKSLTVKDNINLAKVEGKTIYTSGEEEVVDDIDILKGSFVLYGYNVTKPMLNVVRYSQNKDELKVNVVRAVLPFSNGTISPCTNENYLANSVLFVVSTPFVYQEVYSYSLQANKYEIVQKYEHTGEPIKSKKFKVEVVNVPATDAETIPLTIIAPAKKKESKLLLNFYGCYGMANRVGYDNVTIAALQKGWTICHAHIRGGNERGKKWHTKSQGDNRKRAWMDIEECVGYLIREGYTHPSLLFLGSSSAGAVNLWNAILRKPYLYKGAIFRVPFLDVLTSLLDSSQPLSNTDYQQFGNPIDSVSAYRQISAISPYQNIVPAEYPAIHVIAGENDYRTPIAQIAKFVSRFRDRAIKSNKLGEIGVKGVTVDISSTGNHLGESSIKDQNYRGCDMFGYMDYVINSCSKDCRKMES